ncbi:hypothetical protein PVE_P0111 (plasmid) [Pseudomonas veronii 1YdBTEX2]|uniref:Uncharacterized protein n=1 Tax=Pseudomonas veronii 1YdBTEX2 TaxID=1295141 RepID=A0A1D3K9W3_PSEVE|nr:hypothetical protein PVE_P0111 [Pseudomonas veronii 1YdBTEX2]
MLGIGLEQRHMLTGSVGLVYEARAPVGGVLHVILIFVEDVTNTNIAAHR